MGVMKDSKSVIIVLKGWFIVLVSNVRVSNTNQYQPSVEGGARSPPATQHPLQNPKWPPGGPKMADGVWKGVYP